MKSCINDTLSVAKLVGNRLKRAREEKSLSRQAFCDRINEREGRPIRKGCIDRLDVERLKKWESGENPTSLEWLPLICTELDVDVGYLFGEYEEYKRACADIVAATRLSSRAVRNILSLHNTHEFAILDKLLSSVRLFHIIRELEDTTLFTRAKIKEVFDGRYKNDTDLYELSCMAGYLSRRNADRFAEAFEDICGVRSLNNAIAEMRKANNEH